jgi:nucleotide-binding universal stress UspA family protein
MSVKIMIPLDGSLFSEQALPVAYEIARRSAAELHLVKVHVTPGEPTYNATFISAVQLDEEVREADREYLARAAEAALWQTDEHPVTALLTGPVLSALRKYTRECEIGLIVMTTHGRGGLSRAWVGSVADALVRSVHVPVLLLRPQGGEAVCPSRPFVVNHIVIPVDGTALSCSVIPAALALGAVTHARYTLLRVVIPPPSTLLTDTTFSALPNALVEDLRRNATQQLEQIAEPLRAEEYLVDTVVVLQSHIASGIIDVALGMQADLIAMATHGRAGFSRLALGSVTDKVMRGSTVPLLLWRPEGDEAGATLEELAAAV